MLQMPITSRCNSRCKTCNVWKYSEIHDIDPAKLAEVLKDPYFSNVNTVGLNGGEFTLVPNFIDILKAVLTLPSISYVALITNGLFPKRLFEYLQTAKKLCDEKNVSLSICLSIDGIGKIHETVRGIPNCWSKSLEIIDELYQHKEKYCTMFSIGCTLSKHNIEYVRPIENFFKDYPGLKVEFHIAVPNRRIKTFDDSDDYYLLTDNRLRLLATEFFFEKFLNAESEQERRQMYVNYYFLKNHGKGRLCTCDYIHRDITIDEQLNLALCATASKNIGNLNNDNVQTILKSRSTRTEENCLKEHCDTCIHYSYHPLTLKGRLRYIQEIIKGRFVYAYYDGKAIPNRYIRTKKMLHLYARVCKTFLKLSYRIICKLR